MEVAAAKRSAALPKPVEQIRADFPLLAARGERQAARLPGQRRDLAEAGERDRGDRLLLPQLEREHPSRRLRPRGRVDRALRGSEAEGRRLHRRAVRGDDLHPQRHRGDQPRALLVGPAERHRRRRRADHADGAPLEHRSLAAPVRGAGREARLPDRRRRRQARPRRARRQARRRPRQARRRHPRLERARNDQPGRRDRATRCTRRARRCWSTGPRRFRSCRST